MLLIILRKNKIAVMLKQNLIEFFERDLNKLITEISLYKNDNNLWMVKEGISNCAGNLALHLVGNLNHFIGATLGNTGYIRNREAEFTLKNVPRKDLLTAIENTIPIVKNTLEKLMPQDFEKDFPLPIFGKTDTTGYIIMHLITHLTYHLGQINYHRRLLD
jgi:Protein of unknown function (DUF1572)